MQIWLQKQCQYLSLLESRKNRSDSAPLCTFVHTSKSQKGKGRKSLQISKSGFRPSPIRVPLPPPRADTPFPSEGRGGEGGYLDAPVCLLAVVPLFPFPFCRHTQKSSHNEGLYRIQHSTVLPNTKPNFFSSRYKSNSRVCFLNGHHKKALVNFIPRRDEEEKIGLSLFAWLSGYRRKGSVGRGKEGGET